MTLLEQLRAMPPGSLVPANWVVEQLKDSRSAEPAGCQDPTVQQLADELGRSPSTVRGWIGQNTFPNAYRLNHREWRVPRGDVAAYLDRQRPADREQTKLGNRRAEADLRSWSKHVPPIGKKSGASSRFSEAAGGSRLSSAGPGFFRTWQRDITDHVLTPDAWGRTADAIASCERALELTRSSPSGASSSGAWPSGRGPIDLAICEPLLPRARGPSMTGVSPNLLNDHPLQFAAARSGSPPARPRGNRSRPNLESDGCPVGA